MILDLARFIEREKPLWDELEARLNRLEAEAFASTGLDEINRLHYLYERASSDLAALQEVVAEPDLRASLESLVARAYGEIHAVRTRAARFAPWRWFSRTFPRTFRARWGYFAAAASAMLAGMVFGAFALMLDPEAKPVLLPFDHLQGSPAERVAEEERAGREELVGHRQGFSAFLMTHNTRVSIFTLGMGVTFGAGTLLLLLYNGIILGAVCADYIAGGQGVFLAGWLLPHGVIEIPAILIAGQAGLLLGRAMIGWGDRRPMKTRARDIVPDLVTLIGGVAILLVWAGIMESFLSQYHKPVLPYGLKIGIGLVEATVLALFLARSGRAPDATDAGAPTPHAAPLRPARADAPATPSAREDA